MSTYTARQLFEWLQTFSGRETHRAVHYDLEVSLDPAAGYLAVDGTVRLSGPRGGLVRFLLHPDLELVVPDGEESRLPDPTEPGSAVLPERTLRLAPESDRLPLHYRGRLPREWVAADGAELALYNLWFPLFTGGLAPFEFRVVLRVPPDAIPVLSGRLAPLPPELRPAEHDDTRPRTYLWESLQPANDITLCAGPFLVHQRHTGRLSVEAYVSLEDYDLGERYVELPAAVWPVLERWFGPIPPGSGAADPRLAVAVPPRDNWGAYARPGLIVAPSPLSAALRDPEKAGAMAGFVAHELGHLWFGFGVRSDMVGEPWLSEAFAEFARLAYVQAALGDAAYRERLSRYQQVVAGAVDPRPMREVTAAHPEMDALARLRGGLMLARLREEIGDDALTAVLTGLVRRYWGKTLTTEDFLREASDLGGPDLRPFLAAYLDEPPPDPEG